MRRASGVPMAVQIALAIILAVAVGDALAYVRVSDTVQRNTAQRFSDNVLHGAAQARDQLAENNRLMESGANVLSVGPAITDRFERSDFAGIVDLAVSQRAAVIQAVPQQTSIILYDASGKVLLRAHAPSPVISEPLPDSVRKALAGTAVSGLRHEVAWGLVFAAAAPIRGSDGHVLGVMEVLTRADQQFVARLASLTGTDVAIVQADGTSVSSPPGLRPAIGDLPPGAGAAQPVEVKVGKEQYLSMVVPLRSASDEQLGLLYVGVARTAILAEQHAAQREVLAATAIAMLLGVVFAVGLGVVFTQPLTSLVSAARRIQENDLESTVPRAGPRELRQLGAAMDEMRSAIRETREEMIGANEQLGQRADASAVGLAEVTQELSLMHGISTGIERSPAEAPRVVAEQLGRLPWADYVAVFPPDGHGTPTVAGSRELSAANVALLHTAVRQQLEGLSAEGLYVQEIAQHEAFAPLALLGVQAIAVLPLPGPGASLGALVICADHAVAFTDERRSLLEIVRTELATAIERYTLTHAVEENRRLAESVLREMKDGAIVLDTAGRCEVCNPAAALLLGVNAASVIGRPIEAWSPLPPATFERLRRSADDAMDEPAEVLLEHNGRLLSFTAGPLLEPDGTRRAMIVLARDVTETVAAERLKQDFISMVGHELRTPLTLIRTSIDLLTEQAAGGLSPTQRRITGVLQTNSERLLRLINDLLDMSALESGRLRVHQLPTDLRSILEEVLPNYEHEADEREIVITSEVPPQEVSVWADRARIGQVLSNLLDNAMKYTPGGGHIAVRILPGRTFALVQVEDNGIGIPPDEQEEIFHKFQRTSRAEHASGGTGLGLAIARSIVELHGGKIWCESDGKSGSTFSFTVPCEELESAPPGA